MKGITKLNGVSLWVETNGSGIPLVLCHGGPGSYDYMKPVADMVKNRCYVVRYEQRGSWRSEAKEPYTVETFINDLDQLREHLGFKNWIVGGHSWGADLALSYAAQYQSRVQGLIYISGTGINPNWHDDYRQNRLNRLSKEERQEYIYLRSIGDKLNDPDKTQAVQRIRQLSLQADVYYKHNLGNLPRTDAHFMNKKVNQVVGNDWNNYKSNSVFKSKVASIRAPIMILHGEEDPRSLKYAIELSNTLPSGECQIIPKAGHYPWIDQPSIFKDFMQKFLLQIL